ncbi:putative inositol monophosphatase 3 [Euwallacea fornicatus]|uniref:putative inositol monophosphatase 3 n=1 Tax=Euwallacea fornicatus TaxID=995702 RepID=UPI00338EA9A6
MAFGAVIKLNKKGYTLLILLIIILVYFHFHNRHVKKADNKISLLHLLQVSIEAAEAGGKYVVSTRNDLKIKSKGKTKEGLDDSVTTADLMSHCAMEHVIKSALPMVHFVSEEKDVGCEFTDKLEVVEPQLALQGDNVLAEAKDITVWIDPLDATHEYTEKLFQYVTTMVCVAVKGNPVIGVIHNPFNKTTSWAVVGKGYSANLKPNVKRTDSDIKVIISRSHSGTIKEVLEKNCENCKLLIAAGAGYKALQVAEGAVDAYLHITAIKKWDICAGHAILTALGGQMTTKYGKPLMYYNESEPINTEGLIATLKNHNYFLNKL